MPVFNGATTIARALNSVTAQTFFDWEIIVIDDGSTDQTGGLVTGLDIPRLKLISHASNRGAAAARNSGIAAASGRWIAFLDSDDSWKPGKLARQLAVLEHADPSIKACASGYHLHKDGREITVSLKLSPEEFGREILFGCTISPGTTLMVAREVFDEIGAFDEEFRRLEDWDWLLRFSEHYDMAFVPEPLADVYLTTQKPALTGSGAASVHEAISRIRSKHLPHLRSWTRKMQLQSSLLVEKAAALNRTGAPLAATLYVIAALVVYPARNLAFFRTLWRSVHGRARPRIR